MEDGREASVVQVGVAVKLDSYSEICSVISEAFDRENSNHQMLVRYLESILFDIKSEKEREKERGKRRAASADNPVIAVDAEMEKRLIAKALVGCLDDIKVMVQVAINAILKEKSEFKNRLEMEWLPKIKIIFIEALRYELKDKPEFRGKEEAEWLIPIVYFLTEPCPVELTVLSENPSPPISRNNRSVSDSDRYEKTAPPLSPKDVVSPREEEDGRKVSFDIHESPQKGKSLPPVAGHGLFSSNASRIKSVDERGSKPAKGKSLVEMPFVAPSPSVPANANRNRNKTPNKGTRKASLPTKITSFVQRFRKGRDDEGGHDSMPGSNNSI